MGLHVRLGADPKSGSATDPGRSVGPYGAAYRRVLWSSRTRTLVPEPEARKQEALCMGLHVRLGADPNCWVRILDESLVTPKLFSSSPLLSLQVLEGP